MLKCFLGPLGGMNPALFNTISVLGSNISHSTYLTVF